MKSHIKIFILFVLLALTDTLQSQGIVLTNNSNIVIKNNAYLVLGDSSTIPNIDTLNGGGQIISENENNTIRWYIGNTIGDYLLPFGTQTLTQGGNGNKIPLSFKITTVGNVGGYIDFSTYETISDDNTPYPTGVTNLFSSPSVDNSLKLIDRFWKIDTNDYTTTPEMTINIGYDNTANEIGGTNTITESNLFAQNWDASLGKWIAGSGFANTSNQTVENISTTTSGFRPFWSLVDNATPLPIELLTFNATLIEGNIVKLEWQTATEINNDYFTIARSDNGINFANLFNVDGKGNSNNLEYYTINDENPLNGISYYRLKQTDFNGNFTFSKIVPIEILYPRNSIKIYPNPSTGILFVKGANIQKIEVTTIDGKSILLNYNFSKNGIIHLANQSNGVYIVKVTTPYNTEIRKILIKR